MDRINWHRIALGWFPYCGIIPPLLTFLVSGTLGALRPDYHPLTEYMSDLAAAGQPYGEVLSAWWMAFPIEFAPFALAVYHGMECPCRAAAARRQGSARLAWVVPALLLIFAFGIGLGGVFPCAPGCRGTGFNTLAHKGATGVAALALFPCPFLFWLCTRQEQRWQTIASWGLGFQAAGTVLLGGYVLLYWHIIDLYGLVERAYFGVYYTWVVLVAWKLLRLGKREREVTLDLALGGNE